MTPWLAPSLRWLPVTLLPLLFLPADARAQGSIFVVTEPNRTISLTGALTSGYPVSASAGMTVGAEQRLGLDRHGRQVNLRVRAGLDRLHVPASHWTDNRGRYIGSRHVGIGVTRRLLPGPTEGFDAYVFAQVNRDRFQARGGSSRTRGISLGAGIDVAPIGAGRAFVAELEYGFSGVPTLPGLTNVGGITTRRIHIGYKRRF